MIDTKAIATKANRVVQPRRWCNGPGVPCKDSLFQQVEVLGAADKAASLGGGSRTEAERESNGQATGPYRARAQFLSRQPHVRFDERGQETESR
jgi:hypothetical protein